MRLLPWLLAACLWTVPMPTVALPATDPPPLLLANVFGPHIDVGRYLVSEKLDGVRAVWDGQTLRFRSGRIVPAPRWFLERLPPHALDGELWQGRGRFDALSALVRSGVADDAAWAKVRYMVFEQPGGRGSFADRARRIEQIVGEANWPQLQGVPQQMVADRAALQRLLDSTVAAGGEGLMLHLADAPYSTGRGDVLVKMKPQFDSEAVVIGHRPGRGRLAGSFGALQLQTPDGRRFWLGSGFSDEQRRNPPALGSVVTYRYRDLTATGLPRFATFVRLHETF
ncbi:DNA ligase [Piscinibacter sakaiensis]|uniref:DNA ligase n=1 Tax=Piscinibacter sakaiensis TaxID=1547922 RepID=UPI003AAFA3D2